MREIHRGLSAIREGLKSFTRPHHARSLSREEREIRIILAGGILPEDREQYIDRRLFAITARYFNQTGPGVTGFFNPAAVLANIDELKAEEKRLRSLKPEELDLEVKANARAKAKSLGIKLGV